MLGHGDVTRLVSLQREGWRLIGHGRSHVRSWDVTRLVTVFRGEGC